MPGVKQESWPKQNGDCYDSKGIPIYAGDLLRTPHFRGPRRRQYYLYHVVVFDRDAGGLRMEPYYRLDPQLRDDRAHSGGNPLLTDRLAMAATVIEGAVEMRNDDGVLILFNERPKKCPLPDGETFLRFAEY